LLSRCGEQSGKSLEGDFQLAAVHQENGETVLNYVDIPCHRSNAIYHPTAPK
jgi:hypothetical protein